MSIGQLEQQARDVVEKLDHLGAAFCLVGGIAVSFRAFERTTRDLDLAVAVADDAEAERIVRYFKDSGYVISQVLEHDVTGRLSTVRLTSPGDAEVFIDLLFASSGIEPEIVAAAEPIEVFPGLSVRVANIPSLIAVKVLSADNDDRLQDVIDLKNLIKESSEADIRSALAFLALITERGYARNKDLQKDLEGYLARQ